MASRSSSACRMAASSGVHSAKPFGGAASSRSRAAAPSISVNCEAFGVGSGSERHVFPSVSRLLDQQYENAFAMGEFNTAQSATKDDCSARAKNEESARNRNARTIDHGLQPPGLTCDAGVIKNNLHVTGLRPAAASTVGVWTELEPTSDWQLPDSVRVAGLKGNRNPPLALGAGQQPTASKLFFLQDLVPLLDIEFLRECWTVGKGSPQRPQVGLEEVCFRSSAQLGPVNSVLP